MNTANKILCIFIIVIINHEFAQAQEHGSGKLEGALVDVQFDINSLFANVPVQEIGGNDVTVRVNTSNTKYFIVPVLLPDWNKYKEALGKSNGPGQITIDLPVQFRTENIVHELVNSINAIRQKKNLGEITQTDLCIVPYVFYEIAADLGRGGLTPVYYSIDLNSVDRGINLMSSVSISNKIIIPITGTFEELEYLYEHRMHERALVGTLFSRGYSVRSTSVSVHMKDLLSSSNLRSLSGDEKFETTTKVTSDSSGGGFAVNLGIVGFGKSKSSVTATTTTSRQRIVSRDYIESFVKEKSTNIEISSSGKPEEVNAEITKLVDYLLASCTETTLEFQKHDDNNWSIGNDLVGYCNLGERQIDEVLSAKPTLETESSHDSTFEKEKKAKATTKNTFTSRVNNDISWSFNGEDWVPSKVDLYILDTSQLTRNVNIFKTMNIVSDTSTTSYQQCFLNPAAVVAINQDWLPYTDLFNQKTVPVGTIVAFWGMIAPKGWLLCDGKPLPTDPQYDTLRSLVGDSAPDLRGMFLRGLDNGRGIDPDRILGSPQEDGFQDHRHQIFRNSGYIDRQCCNAETSPVNERDKDKNIPDVVWTSASNGRAVSETRPKNVSVNFVIKH